HDTVVCRDDAGNHHVTCGIDLYVVRCGHRACDLDLSAAADHDVAAVGLLNANDLNALGAIDQYDLPGFSVDRLEVSDMIGADELLAAITRGDQPPSLDTAVGRILFDPSTSDDTDHFGLPCGPHSPGDLDATIARDVDVAAVLRQVAQLQQTVGSGDDQNHVATLVFCLEALHRDVVNQRHATDTHGSKGTCLDPVAIFALLDVRRGRERDNVMRCAANCADDKTPRVMDGDRAASDLIDLQDLQAFGCIGN